MSRVVWQVGAGDAMRSYARIFLDHDVALIGPGDEGRWRPDRDDTEFGGSFVRRFADEAKVDDAIVLRTGTSSFRAVGLIAEPYEFRDVFDDVNGWDLQHARRVRWLELPQEHSFPRPAFGASPARFSRVGDADVIDLVTRILGSPPAEWQRAPLRQLPPDEVSLAAPPIAIAAHLAEVQDLASMYWDVAGFGVRPKEDEVVAHCVIPLLRRLGWPAEHLGVKWWNVDVALFSQLPRKPENLALIIEAKRFGTGVEGALDQGLRYLEKLGAATPVVVTDGIRYRAYDTQRNALAYANLARLKSSATKLFSLLEAPQRRKP